MKIIAWLSLALSTLAIIPSYFGVSGLAVVFLSQIAGGIAFANGILNITIISASISFLSLTCISILSLRIQEHATDTLFAIFILMLPFTLGVIYFLIRRIQSKT